ncbi:MAG TPA: ABC transporter permease, partial [Candidatus Acidoferrales bacterium]
MDTLWQDMKYAARTLRRRPSFTLIAVLTLAVGIGGNTAIFTLVHSVLLRPLAYPESGRLVYMGQQFQGGGHSQATTMFKAIFWQRHAEAFEGMTAETGAGYNLTGGSLPERVTGSLVSHDFFRVLGVQPVLGRGFTAEEDSPGGPSVVILTDGVWKRLFGADPGVLGRTVRLNERPYEVIGVLPPGFAPDRSAEIFVPLRLSERTFDPGTNYAVTARLKPGVTLEQARADAKRVFEMFRTEHPGRIDRFEVGISIHPLQDLVVGEARTPLLVLFGAVGLVLLIACANVANLLLARAASRTREIAVRVAMGAGRGRILRQLICESLAMAVTGGVAGLLLAVWMRDALLAVVPAGLPRVREITLDANVLFFALGLSVVTGVVFGLVSMLQVGRVDLSQSLKEGGERSA